MYISQNLKLVKFTFQIGFLTVYKKADIIRVSGAEGVNEGGEARLKCEAEGYPTPTVYWTRAEKDVPIILKDRNGGNKREGWYYIHSSKSNMFATLRINKHFSIYDTHNHTNNTCIHLF